MITWITMLCIISTSLILSLFTRHKLAFVACCFAAFFGAYVLSPQVTGRSHFLSAEFHLHSFLIFDMPLIGGTITGLFTALYMLNQWQSATLGWAIAASFSLGLVGLMVMALVISGCRYVMWW